MARTVDLLGDWWTPLVLRDAMYGIRRFEDFERSLGLSRNVLSQRLGRLVDEGLLDKVAYQERPVRHEYRLTDKGRDLFGVIAALLAWGDRWMAPDGPPVRLHHTTCGHETTPQVVCSECGDPLDVREVRGELGPGYPRRLRNAAASDGRFGPVEDDDGSGGSASSSHDSGRDDGNGHRNRRPSDRRQSDNDQSDKGDDR